MLSARASTGREASTTAEKRMVTSEGDVYRRTKTQG
jgi:hypothetical protein